MDNLQELEKVIKDIDKIYKDICFKWNAIGKIYNQSKVLVKDVFNSIEYFQDVLNYVDFLNNKTYADWMQLSKNNSINRTRVKQINSIYYKTVKYAQKKVNGEVGTIPMNKCFNDLFGLRVISNYELKYEAVALFIKEKFPNLKCIDSSKGEYKAIHIYFKLDNMHYQWELQLWNKDDATNNYESHKKHKQEYTKWEKLFNTRR
jgi:hypothetical protein